MLRFRIIFLVVLGGLIMLDVLAIWIGWVR